MLYWDESMSESLPDMDHRLTITGMQDAVGSRTVGGLDVVYTKLAVDLQNLVAEQSDQVLMGTLETLRDELECDASCVAFLDESGRRIERVIAARGTFAICNPEVLTGVSMAEFPWLDQNLQHLRVRGIADTADPSASVAADAARLAMLGCGALLLIGFDVHGRRGGFMALFFSQPQS